MPKKHTVSSLSEIHTILGSETRLGIAVALSESPTSVTDLSEAVGVSVTAISQHLQKMRGAGIVESTRNAQTITYRLTEPVHPVVAATLALLESGR